MGAPIPVNHPDTTQIRHVASPAPRAVWDEMMRGDPSALETQAPAWTDAMCEAAGFTDASRMYEMSDGRRLVLPLLRRSVGGVAVSECSNPLHCGVGGLVAPQGPRTTEIAAVLREIEQRRVLLRTFWPHPLRAAEWAAATPAGGVTVSRRAHLLDLRDGWDKVWSTSFTASRRRGVRTAERRGVTVCSGSAGQLLPEFYDLLELATARWARMQHEPRWLTLQRLNRRDPLKKFSSAARCLGGRFRVWIAWVDGRPVAGSVVLQGQNAYYFRGAMDERMKEFRPNDLLMARAIEDACRAGCRSYYMGDSGWSPSAGDFKERFGARPLRYSEYRFERLPFSRAEREIKSIVKRAIRFRDF
jgi:CelD/BcsL family acetyltransferase involved in cellulose biosynthesis